MNPGVSMRGLIRAGLGILVAMVWIAVVGNALSERSTPLLTQETAARSASADR